MIQVEMIPAILPDKMSDTLLHFYFLRKVFTTERLGGKCTPFLKTGNLFLQ